MNGRISRSSTLMARQNRETGRYEDPRRRVLLALGIGVILTCFQMYGMLADCNDRLKSLVRYCRPSGPKSFRWSMVKPSWPAVVELVAGIFCGLPYMVCREKEDVVVQRVVTQELTSYATCFWIGSMWNYGCNLLTEGTCFLVLVRFFLVVESDCLRTGRCGRWTSTSKYKGTSTSTYQWTVASFKPLPTRLHQRPSGRRHTKVSGCT